MSTTEIQKKKKNKRACVFGYPVNVLKFKKAASLILRYMKNRQGMQVITINPEMIEKADKTPKLAEIIRKAELVVPDSVGVILALDSMNIVKVDKITGIDLSERLLKKSAKKGYKVAFLGGTEEINKRLNEEVKKEFPNLNVVFSHHGFFKDEELGSLINKLKEADPHLLLVGMGSPKQEIFIDNIRAHLDKTVMIGVGGSIDIWAKRIRRAPVLLRFFGLEWFYRLITQPKRIRRMFPTLPKFLFRVLFDRSNLRKDYYNKLGENS